jgi:hypothetical protein
VLWVYLSGVNVLYKKNKEFEISNLTKPDVIQKDGAVSFTKNEMQNNVSFSSKNKFFMGEKVMIPRSNGVYNEGRIVTLGQNQTWRVILPNENNNNEIFKDLKANHIGKIPSKLNIKKLESYVMRWSTGEISNLDYLMILNALTGRRKGDVHHHPIIPWVIDFTSEFGNYRDLTKSKYRLNKGDQMLEFTYNSQNPHHITEVLSEITYFCYFSRRTPVEVLKKNVRSNYEPKEYPSSIQRFYTWSPDECFFNF